MDDSGFPGWSSAVFLGGSIIQFLGCWDCDISHNCGVCEGKIVWGDGKESVNGWNLCFCSADLSAKAPCELSFSIMREI